MWFLDSFKFQSASLAKLVKNLGKDDMTVIKELFKLHGLTNEQVDVLCKKGVIPYIWFDNYDKMECRSLPEKRYFQNEDEYEYACETFEDYHDKYLLADVILLAGCFHAFRKSIYKMHKTDPAYFLGFPGLSWSLAMKNIPEGSAIELLEKPEDYLAFQNSIQGGICQVSQRYVKRKYDEKTGEVLNQIMYFDVNGLYAHIMANCKLPYKLIEHRTEDIPTFDYGTIKKMSESEEFTYFFVIDASISALMIERNPGLNYLPFFPKRINERDITKSEFMKSQGMKHEIKDGDTFKLACSLDKTERYLVHIKCLKLALDAGYKLDKIHEYYVFS